MRVVLCSVAVPSVGTSRAFRLLGLLGLGICCLDFLGFSSVRTVRVVLCSVAVPSVGASRAFRL